MKRSNAATLAVFSTFLSSRCGRFFCNGYLHGSSSSSGSSVISSRVAFSSSHRSSSPPPNCFLPPRVIIPPRPSSFATIDTTNRWRRRKTTTVTFSTTQSSSNECPLEFEVGPYNAAEVTIDANNFPDNNNDEFFLDQLDRSIDYWKSNDYTSAWVSVPVHQARLIQQLSSTDYSQNFGFDLHHTNATLQTIVLKKWLNHDIEDKIPPFATHQVGCAGFVLNDQNEILVVREWSGSLSKKNNRTPSKQWKLPGGLLDAGESFEEATCREVMEETGVPCEFESILAFWHRHGLKFGKSDLYYVCLLRPKSLEINKCPIEISAAKWMSIDEFLETQDHPLIRHVLKESFHVVGVDHGSSSSQKVGNSERIRPKAEMQPGGVQWPGRVPYPTYTSKPS